MNQILKGFLIVAVSFAITACSVLEFLPSKTAAPEPEPTISLSRPDVTAYAGADGGVCFTQQDATNLFLYINQLETRQ